VADFALMEPMDWALYWVIAAAVLALLGWSAPKGIAARSQRTPRAWGLFAVDVAIIATVAVLVIALATNGRGCSRSGACFCENDDVACVEQYCR